MSKAYVFISHSTQDRTIAGMVCQALEQRHIPCWIAPRDVPLGLNAFDAIPKGIAECGVLVLILSGKASKSDYVQRELQLALSQKKIIIPLRIEDIKVDGAVDFLLTGVQWLDAFVPPVERHIDALVNRIAAVVEAEADAEQTVASFPPARPQVPASRNVALWSLAAVLFVLLVAGLSYRFRSAPKGTPAQPPAVASPATPPSMAPLIEGGKPPARAAVPAAAPSPETRLLRANPGPASVPGPMPRVAPLPQPVEATPEQLRARAAILTAQRKMRDGDFVAAENYFGLALEIDPESAEAKSGLASARKALREN